MHIRKSKLNVYNCYRSYFLTFLALIVLCFVMKSPAQSMHLASLKKVGEGTMSWMFLDIYHAALLTKSGHYNDNTYPVALTITYLKNINKDRLIKATKEQWLLQGYTVQQITPWLTTLKEIWPNISDGDSLSFVIDKSRIGTFYHNKTRLGKIDSAKLSDAFIAIWLSNKTSEPALRGQLLGQGH